MAVSAAGTPALAGATDEVSPGLARLALYWPRLGLALVLGIAACLEWIGLGGEGYANTYYAAGVKSMLTSWHNFFYVSSDAGGLVSLDKPPLGLWIQAASAKLFGFSGLSVLAPEALAGVLSVALVYLLVAPAFGAAAGLLAALILALTPISAIIDRNNTIDSLLILTLLLGAWAISLAAERAQLRWLVVAALLVGLGFNIKMLQAYLVVPAFALVYLLGARLPWRTRLAHLALAALVGLAISASWIAAVDATPAGQRPFVSDSGANSALSLALGYNGLGRLTQALFPGTTRTTILGDPIDLSIVPAFAPEIGDAGPFRLLSPALGGQASWFLLPALAGLLAVVRPRRVSLPLDRRGQALLLWGGWLLTAGLFFSTGRFFHLYYLAMLAPPIAALAGIGLTALWRAYLQPAGAGRLSGWRGWLLPATLVGTALLQVRFLEGYPDWSGWLAAVLVGCCLLAAAVLAAGRLRLVLLLAPGRAARVTPPVALGALLLGLAALLAAPATWSVAAIAGGQGGAWLPQAGPSGQFGGPGGFRGQGRRGGFPFAGGAGGFRFNGSSSGFPGGTGQGNPPLGTAQGTLPGTGQMTPLGGGQQSFSFAGGRRGGFGGGGAMTFAGSGVPALDPKLLGYLREHQGSARYLVATATSSYASLFILQTGQSALALGGYQGWDRVFTPATLARLVAGGPVRFFYLSPAGAGGGPGRGGFGTALGAGSQDLAAVNDDLTSWVARACTPVPVARWQTTSGGAPAGGQGRNAGAGLRLYDCVGKGA